MYAVIMVRHAVRCSHEPKTTGAVVTGGAAVAAMGQRGKGGSAEAVVANLAIAEKASRWRSPACSCASSRRRGPRRPGRRTKSTVSPRERCCGCERRPARTGPASQPSTRRESWLHSTSGRQRGTPQRRPAGDLLAMPLKQRNIVAAIGRARTTLGRRPRPHRWGRSAGSGCGR